MKKLLIVLALVFISACSGPSGKYNVEVTYQYENDENVSYIMTFDDYYSFNSTVKDFDVSYSFPAGYVNKLTVVATVTFYPDGRECSYRPRELMYVPDRKFKVVSVKAVKQNTE